MIETRKTLHAIRTSLGLTQGQFGEILGISGQQVSAIEKGRSAPTTTLLKLAIHEFGVPPETVGLGSIPPKRSLEDRSKKAFAHIVLAACVTAPVAPILAGSVAAGVGAATIIMRLRDAYNAKTDSALAIKMDIQRGALWQWKKRGSIPPKYLLKASEETGKTVEWLISGGGEKFNSTLLEETFLALENACDETGASIEKHVKAKLLSYLFDEFQKQGSIDQEKISIILKLLQ